MRDDRNYRDLSEEEQKILWKKFREGDKKSRRDLIQYNYPLVRAIAARFDYDKTRSDDLFHGGVIGLMEAMERFDPERGVSFGTFAFPYIKGEVLKSLSEMKGCKKQDYKAVDQKAPLQAALQRASLSLEEWLENGESLALADLRAEEMFESVEDRIALHAAVAQLSEPEKRLLYYRYVLKKNQTETGKELLLSQTRISRKEQEILAKLRGMI
ncbi:MAG: sigma-70 family RNA polymerase sigma factor [Firmicutes bacterium]|nr:sigma-70 family RNA polymerase sigma factor [Bacillota bacterium]